MEDKALERAKRILSEEENERRTDPRSPEGEEGNGGVDFLTWVEDLNGDSEEPIESEGERGSSEADGEPTLTRVSER